jgi:rod shape-determining protein MreC
MKDFFRSLKFKALVALTAIIIGIMIFSLRSEGQLPDSSALFTYISEPFSRFSVSLENGFSDWLSTFTNAEANKEENEILKKQLGEAYNNISDYEDLKRENAELRALLDLKEKDEGITYSRPCVVIARTVGDPYRSFILDSGAEDGIAPFDPVVTADGLVGVITEVTRTTASVQTLYSPKSAVSVVTARSTVKGIIEGDIALMEQNTVRMNYIDKAADIQPGDVIKTEGSEMYPPGRIVGIVRSVTIEDNGLAKYAEVELLVDPTKVTSLYVITAFNGQAGDSDG